VALILSELYTSLAGETSWVGLPCTFIRLAGCNLNCSWCDTPYARKGGRAVTVKEVVDNVIKAGTKLVCVTGGEPLLQEETPALARKLLKARRQVLVETNGSISIETIPTRVRRIVDVKTPSSGEVKSFLMDNLRLLTARDELKFVVANMRDFGWVSRFVEKHNLAGRRQLLVSPASGRSGSASEDRVFRQKLAQKIATSGIPFRYNVQLHKVIWGARKRGV